MTSNPNKIAVLATLVNLDDRSPDGGSLVVMQAMSINVVNKMQDKPLASSSRSCKTTPFSQQQRSPRNRCRRQSPHFAHQHSRPPIVDTPTTNSSEMPPANLPPQCPRPYSQTSHETTNTQNYGMTTMDAMGGERNCTSPLHANEYQHVNLSASVLWDIGGGDKARQQQGAT